MTEPSAARRDRWQGGDSAAGYEVRIHRPRRLLRFTFWGIWDEPLAREYLSASIEGMHELQTEPGGWNVLADLRRYPAQSDEVSRCHAESMKAAQQLGLKRAGNLVAGSLSALQIRRLSTESGLPDFSFFQDEAQALNWLDTGARPTP
jgi:hypothetical protein